MSLASVIFPLNKYFFASLLCARHYSSNWGTIENNTKSLYPHSMNILVGKTDNKYANHGLVFPSGPLSLLEHPVPPPLTPTPELPSATGGLQNWLRQRSKSSQLGKPQSLLSCKPGITFASPFSFPLTAHIQSPSSGDHLPLLLPKLPFSPPLAWVSAVAFQPLVSSPADSVSTEEPQ